MKANTNNSNVALAPVRVRVRARPRVRQGEHGDGEKDQLGQDERGQGRRHVRQGRVAARGGVGRRQRRRHFGHFYYEYFYNPSI